MRFRLEGDDYDVDLSAAPFRLDAEIGAEVTMTFEDPEGHLAARIQEFAVPMEGEVVGGPLDGQAVRFAPPDPLD